MVPHSENFFDSASLWLAPLGALPQEGTAEAKLDATNMLPLDKDLHGCLDSRPSHGLLVPSRQTMVELCLVAETKMAREESHMAQQPPGMLWRLAPQALTAGWAAAVVVEGQRVQLFEHDFCLAMTDADIRDMQGEFLRWVVEWDGTYPTEIRPKLPRRWLAVFPAMSLPMLLAAVNVGIGSSHRPLSDSLVDIVDMARYWLALASAEHVTQWRRFTRPQALPPNRSLAVLCASCG